MIQRISLDMLCRRGCFVIVALIFLFLESQPAIAQDPQYSQFYAAPLYLNPAFAGSTGQARVGINYRNQWPSISANFTTVATFFDLYIEDINSGVGALLSQDKEGVLGLESFNFALLYSYNIKITKWLSARTGFQASLFYRSINFDKLTFGDQFNPQTGEVINPASVEGLNTGGSTFFPSIAGGVLLYTKNIWLGASTHHLTEPNQSLLGEESRLPLKISAHAGIKFHFKPGILGSGIAARASERSLAPTLQYRHQGTFDQLDLGLYCTLEPIVFGIWYRGVPFKIISNFVNNEAVVFLIGFTKRGYKDAFNIGYSYDYTISNLGPNSGGAHEISLSYSWSTRNPRKPAKDKLVIPCPNF